MEIEEWADAQLTFEARYEDPRVGVERRRVKLRWWSVPNRHRRAGAGTVTVLWSMARGNTFDDRDVHVAVYEPDAGAGAAPLVVFVAREGSGLVEGHGRAVGTLVGQGHPEGALLVETSRGTVLPASMPAAAEDDTAGWTERESAGDAPAGDAPAPGTGDAEAGAAGRGGPLSRWRRARRASRTRPPAGAGGGR